MSEDNFSIQIHFSSNVTIGEVTFAHRP